jgi:Rrf2 family protein
MEIIRRNTDYALRLIIHLAQRKPGTAVSAHTLSQSELVPSPLSSKLLQKLHKAGIVGSRMGSNGGFFLKKESKDISLADVVEVIQGPLKVNKCILDESVCPRISFCTIRKELLKLQKRIEDFYKNTTIDMLAENHQFRRDE